MYIVKNLIMQDVYSIFKFELLQNLLLGWPKLMNQCFSAYVGSDRVSVNVTSIVEKRS